VPQANGGKGGDHDQRGACNVPKGNAPPRRCVRGRRQTVEIGCGLQPCVIGAYGFGDVLDVLFAEKLVVEGHALADRIVEGAGHADAARFGQGLDARGNVYAVAENVPFIADHVAEIEPHAEENLAFLGQCGVALCQCGLDAGRAAQRVLRRSESGEHGVAGRVDDAAAMARDVAAEYAEALLEVAEGCVLVLLRQAAEPRHVGVQDRHQCSRLRFGSHAYFRKFEVRPGGKRSAKPARLPRLLQYLLGVGTTRTCLIGAR